MFVKKKILEHSGRYMWKLGRMLLAVKEKSLCEENIMKILLLDGVGLSCKEY